MSVSGSDVGRRAPDALRVVISVLCAGIYSHLTSSCRIHREHVRTGHGEDRDRRNVCTPRLIWAQTHCCDCSFSLAGRRCYRSPCEQHIIILVNASEFKAQASSRNRNTSYHSNFEAANSSRARTVGRSQHDLTFGRVVKRVIPTHSRSLLRHQDRHQTTPSARAPLYLGVPIEHYEQVAVVASGRQ